MFLLDFLVVCVCEWLRSTQLSGKLLVFFLHKSARHRLLLKVEMHISHQIDTNRKGGCTHINYVIMDAIAPFQNHM